MPDKSLPTLAAELWDLVRAYAKQETIEPLKGIGRWVAFGSAGSLCLGIGTVLLATAGLRALQTETGDAFDGNLTFVPYLGVIGVSVLVLLLVLSRIGKRRP